MQKLIFPALLIFGFSAAAAEDQKIPGDLALEAAGPLSGEEIHEEFMDMPLPVVSESEQAAGCIPAQNMEDPLHLSALPIVLTVMGAAAALSGCEVNVGPSGCGAGFMRKPCPGPSPKEMEEIFRQADEKFPGPDSPERCEWELRQLGMTQREIDRHSCWD